LLESLRTRFPLLLLSPWRGYSILECTDKIADNSATSATTDGVTAAAKYERLASPNYIASLFR
jgi:hypothetical protein